MEQSNSFIQSRVPWSTEPSLQDIAQEVGVDYDRLIEGIKEDKSDSEIAGELAVSDKLIYHLRDHFYTRGIHSIMGQD
ncbi:MAG: helix-turn-helix domain-containing protein [Desulfotomaculaceae bacterium]|nr:helix-turn-helix domain-containing protein [Desulfotomaculaceae bacterium]